MPLYVNKLILKLSAVTGIAVSFLIIFNTWILPVIHNGEKKGYVIFPALLLTLVIASWITFSQLKIEPISKNLFISIAYGLVVSVIVLFLSLFVILNTLGA